MEDQVPHEAKIERMERLVELTQRDRDRAQRRSCRPRRAGARRGPFAHRRVGAARPHPPQHDRELRRHGRSGHARRRPDRAGDLDDAARTTGVVRPRRGRLAGLARAHPHHRLVRADRHQPRACGCWPTATGSSASTSVRIRGRGSSRRCSRTSRAPTRPSPAASTGSSIPTSISSSTSPRTRRCTSSSRQPHRALENVMMTFNMLEYCRALELPLVFSSTREVYGDVHRFEEATARPQPTSPTPRARTRPRRSARRASSTPTPSATT